METQFRYAHLHGFASSAKSHKGLLLAEAFAAKGLELILPDLNRPSFSKLTYTAALEGMDELDAAAGDPQIRWRISGSSMGGYLAARWAELNPGRVDRLALLCPGFELGTRWPELIGPDRFERWKEEGTTLLPDALGQEQPVHFGLIEDCRRHPAWPEVPCPTLIFHGTRDETVPVQSSITYAEARPDRVRLITYDDNHYLLNSIDAITAEILKFFGEDS
ncbi:MAG: alpha/beta hydrolase [Planctomycetota bacterium]|jgi:pimeloyl-ACP methyl ester carboxylesterase